MKQFTTEELIVLLEALKTSIIEEIEDGDSELPYEYVEGFLDACNELLMHVYEDFDD